MPRLPSDVEWLLAHRKPEPSGTSLGRAAAKGTGLDYIQPPRLTLAYLRDKSGELPTYPIPVQQVADDTASPLLVAILRRFHPDVSPQASRLLTLLGLDRP